jgi:3-hydroxyisobutyrate dehydrogenase
MRRDDAKPRIGIIGLGIMGAALAARLHERGYRLFLYNRTPSRAHAIAREGDSICLTPAELASLADVVISFVSDDTASEDVWFGADGAATGAKNGSVCIEGSTLSPEYIESWASRLRDRDLQPLEMPVTGSKGGARNGTLSLFMAGDTGVIDMLKPLLADISRQMFRFETIGQATRFKLVYNMLGANILVSFAEALARAEDFRLPLATVIEVMSKNQQGWSAGVAASKGTQMLTHDYADVQCALSTIYKDITYALKGSDKDTFHIGNTTQALIKSVIDEGLGEKDMATVFEYFAKKKG